MKKIIAYQVFILLVVIGVWAQLPLGNVPGWANQYLLAIQCILIAAIGGALYCLRAVYVNRCVRKNWDPDWETWYYLRPLTSSISGFASYIFLKAGLLILDASQQVNSGDFGFLAVAFIAGLNVDKFTLKIEEIAKATFGIDQSRTAKDSDRKD
ncbi:MAG: hypothetical protein OXU23_25580 [Candidatus Poribacteria bacterium]|nr:hypothetical protein [Candidatus Poribacteria bacterium]